MSGKPDRHGELRSHDLAPWIPTESLGQHFLGGKQYQTHPVSTLVAGALLSHPTVFSDLRGLPPAVIEAAGPWTRFYADNRELFTEGVTYPLLADPLEKKWTALQTWDADKARGALVAFRQSDAGDTATVALRGVPDDMVFDLREAPTGTLVGQVTSAELQQGLPITLADKNAARVLLITPAAS